MATIHACSCPGCVNPGTCWCSACKTTFYCGGTCQTADWSRHKEECDGHLLKVGSAYFTKAHSFYDASNYLQALRYSNLALAKFNAMKKCDLKVISDALAIKTDALKFLDLHDESLDCATEKYKLWAMARGPAHPSTIDAAFYLIDSLSHNKKYDDAYHFAYTIWEIIHNNNHVDNDIPGEQRLKYVENAAKLLAQAIFHLSRSGGIPSEEKEKEGAEAITRARQALEINTQLHGTMSEGVAIAMATLANVLNHFKEDCDDEVIDLYKQAIDIHRQLYGNMSINVGVKNRNVGITYYNRANRAHQASDLQREKNNLELALTHLREAAYIYTSINHVEKSERTLRNVNEVEQRLHQITVDESASSRKVITDEKGSKES